MALAASLIALIGESGAEPRDVRDPQGHPVRIIATAFQPLTGDGDTPFTRYEGSLFGLDQENTFSPRDFFPPFFNGRGISSGDIDRDGWPDIVSATDAGIVLYLNRKGQTFAAREIEVPELRDGSVFNVALVDLNGDGWLDLFATTYLDGNFYILNQNGEFTAEGLRRLPRGRAVLSAAVAFGDIDRDGDLDMAIGNWFAGQPTPHPPPHSQNEILINEGGRFEATPLIGLVGETLSMLLSDWTGDGWLDLIVGNDFDAPDIYYRGDGKGGFELIEKQDGIVPISTRSTMSVDSGDFDNDLDLDVFLTQITARATGPSARIASRSMDQYCDDIVAESSRKRCLTNIETRRSFAYLALHRPANVRKCFKTPDKMDQQACVGVQVMMTAHRLQRPELCDRIPQSEDRTRTLCQNIFEEVFPHDPDVLNRSIPQLMNRNILLVWDPKGHFTDEAERVGVGFTGWSWNGRFADVDNDEWQDLYIVSGTWLRLSSVGAPTNFFFHNEAGKRFSDQTDAFGLQNYMIVSAYTIVDFDRDGDLDIITNSVNGPLWLYRNNSRTGHSIVFRLRDEVGNADGIGTKFTIHYGPGGERHQLRELKASGGYLSFDEAVAHFGLGKYDRVERLNISWSTGGSTLISGPFEAGYIYLLERSVASSSE